MVEEADGTDDGIPTEMYGEPPVDVGPLYVPTADYVVNSVSQTIRQEKGGREIPAIEVGFVVPGFPTQHSILFDNYGFTHGDVLGGMRGRAGKIRRLYALPAVTPRAPGER